MAQRGSGLVELGAGWSLELPNECMVERDDAGAWAAWDNEHTIDINIIEISLRPGADALTVTDLLDGRAPTHRGPGWCGIVSVADEVVDGTAVVRVLLTAAAPAAGTMLDCAVGVLAADQLQWAEKVIAGLSRRTSD